MGAARGSRGAARGVVFHESLQQVGRRGRTRVSALSRLAPHVSAHLSFPRRGPQGLA